MGAHKLKYSPSGPVVQNDDGGSFVPGPGMVMRSLLADLSGLTDMDSSEAAAGLQVSNTIAMLHTLESRRYQGIFHVHMRMDGTEWTSTAPLLLSFQTSVDNNVSWQTQDTLEVDYGQAIDSTDDEGYNVDLTFRTKFCEIPGAGSGPNGLTLYRVLASTTDTVAWDSNIISFTGTPSSTFQVNETL